MVFIYIRFGENKTVILNPDCASLNFMLRVKKILIENGAYREDGNTDLDLCDDQGNIKGINRLHAMDTVVPYVQHKETYIPVMVQSDHISELDDVTDFELLLAPQDKLYSKINANIQKLKKLLHRRLLDKGQVSKLHGKDGRMSSPNKKQVEPSQTRAVTKTRSKVIR